MSAAALIHPTAVVSANARLGADVRIGPLCVVGDDVVIGDGSQLVASCVVLGATRIGACNTLHPYAVLGDAPQDKSFADEPTALEIGSHNVFREHVTVHRGTCKGDGLTRVGSHGFFMAGAHIGHDACIGDHATLANGTLIAGHVHLGHHVTCGGGAAIAQFVRIGDGAFVAGGAMVERDVPPWTIAAGDRARVRALNHVALDRCGVPSQSRLALERAFARIFRSGVPRRVALRALLAEHEREDDRYVAAFLAFLQSSREPAERRSS